MAEHRVELAQGGDAAPQPRHAHAHGWRRPRRSASSCAAGTRAAAGRAGGWSPAARHDGEQRDEVLALRRAAAWRAPCAVPPVSSARIISRMARMRPSSKNICSVRQSPMPSAPKARDWRASAGVSALARTRMRRNAVGPPHQRGEVRRELRLAHRHAALDDLPGRAVDGHDVALVQDLLPAAASRARGRSARQRRRPRKAAPCRAPPPQRGSSCRRAW